MDFLRWDVEKVCAWIRKNGGQDYEAQFRQHNVTGMGLPLLTEMDLEYYLQVSKIGTRTGLMKSLEALLQSQPNALDQIGWCFGFTPTKNTIYLPYFPTSGAGSRTAQTSTQNAPSPISLL